MKPFLLSLGLLVTVTLVGAEVAPAPATRTEPRVVIPNTTLNGQPFELILDTGSDTTLFTDSVIQRLGIKFAPPTRTSPASPGTINLGATDSVELGIGPNKYQFQLPVYSMAYPQALIGWPSIKDNILVFDSDQRVIRRVSELPKETADWQKYKLGPDSTLTFLVPQPDGTNGTILVDTGAYHGLALAPKRWQAWRAAHPQAPTVSEPYIGVSIGTGITTEAYAEDISLGAFSLADIMVGEATYFESHNYNNYLGTFGLEALARINFVVDGKKGYVYLQPKPKTGFASPPSGHNDWTLDPSVALNLDHEFITTGWYYLLTGNYALAAANYAHAVDKFPKDADIWCDLGWARENAGDAAGAANAYQHARSLAPNIAAVMRGTGVWLQSTGDNMRAIINYEISLSLLPEIKFPAFETKTLDTDGHDDESALNALGQDGWELIRWGQNYSTNRIHYVFQRPIPSPAAGTLKILSAQFGAGEKLADVTDTVARLLAEDTQDFFVAEKWLKAEPAPGIIKNLKLVYTFAGQETTLTFAENEAVSRDLLMETALGHSFAGAPAQWEYAHESKAGVNPDWFLVAPTTLPPPADGRGVFKRRLSQAPSREVKVISAYYGIGRNFVDVTPLVSPLLQRPVDSFLINPKVMQADPYKGLIKYLLLTYTYGGTRRYYIGTEGAILNREILLSESVLSQDIYTRLYREVLQLRLQKAPPDFILIVARWPDGWAKTIGQFLAGVIDEKTFLAEAQISDLEPVAGQLCEAYYFAGMMRLVKDDPQGARDFFQKSVATGIKPYNEYRFAQAELDRLSDPHLNPSAH